MSTRSSADLPANAESKPEHPVPSSFGRRVSLDTSFAVARLCLRNPPLNIIDLPMMDELLAAIREAERQREVRVIVLRGASRAFSAGVDIRAHTRDQVPAMLEKFHAVIRALVSSQKVTISIVEGACLGGGAELAMISDLSYTARDASWGFPEIKLGCYPPVACAALGSLVGQKRAAELILTGRQISGEEAFAIGLATGAARSEELGNWVEEVIEKVASLSPSALALTKKAFYQSQGFAEALRSTERIYLNELAQTADAAEGVLAWLDKRPPLWTGS